MPHGTCSGMKLLRLLRGKEVASHVKLAMLAATPWAGLPRMLAAAV